MAVGTVDKSCTASSSKSPYQKRKKPYEIPPQDGRCIVNDMPTEILSHIFVLGAQETDDEEDEDEDSSEDEGEEPPGKEGTRKAGDEDDFKSLESLEDFKARELPFELLVTRICRRWREVGLEIPWLWADLDFEEGPPFEKSKAYLLRSKEAPLYLSIDITINQPDDIENDVGYSSQIATKLLELQTILELVVPHLKQWRSLEVMVSDYDLINVTLTTLGDCEDAPNLEVLQLYHYEDVEERDIFTPTQFKDQDFILFHGNVPRLVNVALWGVHLNWEKSLFLSGLLDLELAYHAKEVRPTYRDFARILRDSPNIETLTLCESGPQGGPVEWLASVTGDSGIRDTSVTPTLIHVPTLKNLVLAYLGADYVTALVKRLVLPSLQSLAMDLENADFTDFLETLAKPHPVTGKPMLADLGALKVSGIECSATVVEHVYAALNNVVSLNLDFRYLDRVWYRLLMERGTTEDRQSAPSGKAFIPRLEILTTSGLLGGEYKELVISRRNAGLPLKKMYVNEHDDISDEEEAWLVRTLEQFQYFDASEDDDEDDDDVLEIDMSEPEDDDMEDSDGGSEWEDEESDTD